MGQIVFWVLVGAWVALEVYLQFAYNPHVRQANAEKTSKYIMLASFLLGLLCGRVFFPDFAPGFREPFTFLRVAGLVLLAASVVLRILCIRQLGRSYSVNLGVRPDQRLVTSGLYRLVRHPGYLSLEIGFVGVALCYSHRFASVVCVVVPLAAILYRIRIEEDILEQAFGEQYRLYRARTRMILPGVW